MNSTLSEENDVFTESGFFYLDGPAEYSKSLCSSQLSHLTGSSYSQSKFTHRCNVVHSQGDIE